MIKAKVTGILLYNPRKGAYYDKDGQHACTVLVIQCDSGIAKYPPHVEVCTKNAVDYEVGDTVTVSGELTSYAKVNNKNGKTYAQMRLICD